VRDASGEVSEGALDIGSRKKICILEWLGTSTVTAVERFRLRHGSRYQNMQTTMESATDNIVTLHDILPALFSMRFVKNEPNKWLVINELLISLTAKNPAPTWLPFANS
jgi:hypothetical protein